MGVRRFLLLSVLSAAAATGLASCKSSDDEPSAPPSVAEQCRGRCAVRTDPAHPCSGAKEIPDCASRCEEKVAGKRPECVSCYLRYAGWAGTACSCTEDFGIETTCKECTFTASGKSCDFDLLGGCTDGAKQCSGWKDFPLDTLCAADCDLPEANDAGSAGPDAADARGEEDG